MNPTTFSSSSSSGLLFAIASTDPFNKAVVGIPFGSAMACLLANICLDELDQRLEIPELNYFRYADDLLLMSRNREEAIQGAQVLDRSLAELTLAAKHSHSEEMILSTRARRGRLPVDGCYGKACPLKRKLVFQPSP